MFRARHVLLAAALTATLASGCLPGTDREDPLPATVSLEGERLTVGASEVLLPGYEVTDTGRVVPGWDHTTPGARLVSTEDPFESPTVRALVFADGAGVADDITAAVAAAHAAKGLEGASEVAGGVIEGQDATCTFSVRHGVIDGSDDVVGSSGVVISVRDRQEVGLTMGLYDPDELEEAILTAASELCG